MSIEQGGVGETIVVNNSQSPLEAERVSLVDGVSETIVFRSASDFVPARVEPSIAPAPLNAGILD